VNHPWRRLLVMSAATLILAEVLYQVLEKPFTRIGCALAEGSEGRTTIALSKRSRRLLVAVAVVLGVFFFRHTLMKTFGPRDLALHRAVTQSSHADGKPESDALVNGKLESEFGLHTKKEDWPWAAIDLGQPTEIGSVRIYNRADGYQWEALPLELSVSDDGENFRTIARRDTMFTQFFPWRIRIYDEKARYVRVQVAAKGATLCLSEVEIYEGDWIARLP
jgi:F5/8 type C domain